jgi:hypothetical protein
VTTSHEREPVEWELRAQAGWAEFEMHRQRFLVGRAVDAALAGCERERTSAIIDSPMTSKGDDHGRQHPGEP